MTETGGRSGCRDETGERRESLGGRDLRGWRQVRCVGCGLPTGRCFCAELRPIAVRARVIVVAHPCEAVRSTNTARVAVQMLTNASMRLRGDDYPPAEGKRLVLFPFGGARTLCPDDNVPDLTLVVPDGTWAQARRIARRDPLAQNAEAVTIPLRESAFGLRRSPREGALCTLEAIAEAMRALEGDHVADAMHEVFSRWRERALAVREGRG